MGTSRSGEDWVPEHLAPGALGADRPASSPAAAARRLPDPPPPDVAAVIEALTAVATADRAGGSPREALLDRVRGLGRVLNMAAAELARAVAHAEAVEAAPADGLTGMKAWTRGHLHLSGSVAAALLAQGRLCVRMPVLGAAAAAGAVNPDLLDPTVVDAAVRLGSGASVTNLVARAAACDADIARIVLGPDGLPLDVGRAHRLVPAHIRRAAEVRDGGCVFAGCQAPAWWCDAHHLVHWIDGGATSLDNTALLCERHHTQVHHGFSIRWDDVEHRWRTFHPGDREILLGPIGARAPDPPLFDRSAA